VRRGKGTPAKVNNDLDGNEPGQGALHVLPAHRRPASIVIAELQHLSQASTVGFADVMDRLEAKYGWHTLYFGGIMGMEDAGPTRISFTQIPTVDEF